MALPALFVLLSLVEVSRSMWFYHGLTQALEESARFAVAKTENCSTAAGPCRATIGELAARIRNSSAALRPASLDLSFISPAGAVNCRMESCLNNTAFWPPPGVNTPATVLAIGGKYLFHSPIAEFCIGAGPATILGKTSLPVSPGSRLM